LFNDTHLMTNGAIWLTVRAGKLFATTRG